MTNYHLVTATKQAFIMLAFTFVIFSCDKQEIEPASVGNTTIKLSDQTPQEVFGTQTDQLKLVALTGNYKLSVQNAQEIAMETATQMRALEGVLTKSPLAIASVEKIKGNKKELIIDTKSEEAEKDSVSDMYLFNFEDDQGYVLMSADERVPGVLAYSTEGHLGNKIENPGQGILLERAYYYMQKKRKEFKAKEKELIIAAKEDLFQKLPKKEQEKLIEKGYFDKNGKVITSKFFYPLFECTNLYTSRSYGAWTTTQKIPPLVKTLWGQGRGYNNFVTKSCPNSRGRGRRAWVGCVATAVGQIMAFHKSPATFKGRKMDWNKMVERKKVGNKKNMFSGYYSLPANYTDAKGDISHLLFRLGDSDLLDMEYGCDASGASTDDALKTFKKLGYRNTRQISYNSATAISEIKNNRPVYIDGNDTYTDTEQRRCFLWWCWTTTERTYDAGHAWVLDGYVERTQRVTATQYTLFAREVAILILLTPITTITIWNLYIIILAGEEIRSWMVVPQKTLAGTIKVFLTQITSLINHQTHLKLVYPGITNTTIIC